MYLIGIANNSVCIAYESNQWRKNTHFFHKIRCNTQQSLPVPTTMHPSQSLPPRLKLTKGQCLRYCPDHLSLQLNKKTKVNAEHWRKSFPYWTEASTVLPMKNHTGKWKQNSETNYLTHEDPTAQNISFNSNQFLPIKTCFLYHPSGLQTCPPKLWPGH